MNKKLILTLFSLTFGLLLTSCFNSNKDNHLTIKEAVKIASSLKEGKYSNKEYYVKGYVLNRPTSRNLDGKFSFTLVDDLKTQENKITVFLASSLDSIFQYDEVSVKAYLHSSNENCFELMGRKLETYTYSDIQVSIIESNGNYNPYSATAEETVTMLDIVSTLIDKKEHYPFSDEFVEKYQQKDGGYIEYAENTGHLVDRQKHEPNQKWHFFESWLMDSFKNNTITWEDSAKSRVYSKLLCPELLLWIYEALDADPIKVKKAKEVAEQGRIAGTAVTTIAKNMRACVAWEDLKI